MFSLFSLFSYNGTFIFFSLSLVTNLLIKSYFGSFYLLLDKENTICLISNYLKENKKM